MEKKLFSGLNHSEFSPPGDGFSSKLPFVVRRFGYLTEKKLNPDFFSDPDEIFILYSLSGITEFFRARELQYLTEGDLVLSSCQTPMRFRTVGPQKWEFFYVLLSGSHAKYYYNFIRTKFNMLRVNPLSRVPDLFVKMARSDFSGGPLPALRLSVLAQELLTELYELSSGVVRAKNLLPVQDSDVNAAIAYIKAHYKDDITIDDICNEIHLSKFYFCKIFKRHTGATLHGYLNEYRVQKSRELLSYSQLSVGSVAAAVGFSTPLTYHRAFRKIMGMTPGEYRRNF